MSEFSIISPGSAYPFHKIYSGFDPGISEIFLLNFLINLPYFGVIFFLKFYIADLVFLSVFWIYYFLVFPEREDLLSLSTEGENAWILSLRFKGEYSFGFSVAYHSAVDARSSTKSAKFQQLPPELGGILMSGFMDYGSRYSEGIEYSRGVYSEFYVRSCSCNFSIILSFSEIIYSFFTSSFFNFEWSYFRITKSLERSLKV